MNLQTWISVSIFRFKSSSKSGLACFSKRGKYESTMCDTEFYDYCRNSPRAYWLVYIVSKRTDPWIYNLLRCIKEQEWTIWQFVIVKTIDISFSCVCQVIDNKFSQQCESSLQIHSAVASWIQSDLMTKFMINNRTDKLKTDVNLLIDKQIYFSIRKNVLSFKIYLELSSFPLLLFSKIMYDNC